MTDLPVTAPAAPADPSQVDLPLSSLAAGEYLLELSAASDGQPPATELVAFEGDWIALGVHAAHLRDRRHAVDRDDVGGRAHVDLVLAATSAARRRTPRTSCARAARSLPSRSRSSRGDPAPTRSTTTVTPPALARMSGIDEDAALVQVLVRVGRGRAVGALGDDLRLDLRRVLHRDLVLERRRDQDVARRARTARRWSSGSPPGKPATVLCSLPRGRAASRCRARRRCRRRPSSR